jgi:hypothetical protein
MQLLRPDPSVATALRVAKFLRRPPAYLELTPTRRTPEFYQEPLEIRRIALVSIPGVFVLIDVPSKLIVAFPCTTTASNIESSHAPFHAGIAAEVVSQIWALPSSKNEILAHPLEY